MAIETDLHSRSTTMDGQVSFSTNAEFHQEEGKLGANKVCSQPSDQKTLRFIDRVKTALDKIKNSTQSPDDFAAALSSVQDHITRRRISQGAQYTPVDKDPAPESAAIQDLRQRLLSN